MIKNLGNKRERRLVKTAPACSSARRCHTKGVWKHRTRIFLLHICFFEYQASLLNGVLFPPLPRRKPGSRNTTYSTQASAAQQEAGRARVSRTVCTLHPCAAGMLAFGGDGKVFIFSCGVDWSALFVYYHLFLWTLFIIQSTSFKM